MGKIKKRDIVLNLFLFITVLIAVSWTLGGGSYSFLWLFGLLPLWVYAQDDRAGPAEDKLEI